MDFFHAHVCIPFFISYFRLGRKAFRNWRKTDINRNRQYSVACLSLCLSVCLSECLSVCAVVPISHNPQWNPAVKAPIPNSRDVCIYFGLRLYLLIPAGGECIIRLQRFAVVQPVDGIDRWTRCRTIEIRRSARIDNLNLRQYMHGHIRIDTESDLDALLPKLIRGLANLQRERGCLDGLGERLGKLEGIQSNFYSK